MKTKRLSPLYILAIIILAICVSSCHYLSTAITYKKILTQQVIIPDSLIIIPGKDTSSFISRDSLLKTKELLLWLDSASCISCSLGQLSKYEELYKESKQKNFNLFVLVSPTFDNYTDTYLQLSSMHTSFPIYIDICNKFSDSNPILKEKWSHCLLLGTDGFPLFIGDPLFNDDLYQAFNTIL